MDDSERNRQQDASAVLAQRLRDGLSMDGTLAEADSMRDFTGADLIDAQLYGADLTGVILRDADLRGANLIGAHMRETDLHGANLSGAIFGVDRWVPEVYAPRYADILNFTDALNLDNISWDDGGGHEQDPPQWAVNYPPLGSYGAAVEREQERWAERVRQREAEWAEEHPMEAAHQANIRVRNQLYREQEIARQERETAARAQEWDARAEERERLEAVEEVLPHAREIPEEIEASRGRIGWLAAQNSAFSFDAGGVWDCDVSFTYFDPIMLEDNITTIREYIEENVDNIVLQYTLDGVKKDFLTKKSSINTVLADSIFYPCKKANSSLDETNIIEIPVFKLRAIGMDLGGYVFIDSILNRNSKQLFVLKKLTHFPSYVSKNIRYGGHFVDWTSGTHCQEGQGGEVQGAMYVALEAPECPRRSGRKRRRPDFYGFGDDASVGGRKRRRKTRKHKKRIAKKKTRTNKRKKRRTKSKKKRKRRKTKRHVQ